MITLKTLRSEAEKQAGAVAQRVTHRSATVGAEATKLGAEATKLAGNPTPAYAVVGLTDAVVERARAAGERFGRMSRTLTPQKVGQQLTRAGAEATDRVTRTATDLSGQVSRTASGLTTSVEEAPTVVVSGLLARLGRLQADYEQLAARGEGLVSRVREQQATQELVAQVNSAVRQGRILLSTARTGAQQTQSAARATLTSGRRQAAMAAAETLAGEPVQVEKATAPSGKTTRRATSGTKKASAKAAKSTTTQSTTTKSAAKKSAATKAKAETKPATRRSTAARTTATPSTGTAAKRATTTATNRAEETAAAGREAATATAKAAEQATDAASEAAAKLGD
jgi:hypothetical protein